MNAYDWLIEQGFDPDRDALLFAYLRHWEINNQFMQMNDPAEQFAASRGYVEYLETGSIDEWDD